MTSSEVRVYHFKKENLEVQEFSEFKENPIMEDEFIWIEVNGFNKVNDVLDLDLFKNVHPLLREDMQELNPRAKMQYFEPFNSIVLKLLSAEKHKIKIHQLNLIVSKDVILTVFEKPFKGLDDLKMQILEKPIKKMDVLLHGILDAVVDDYNIVFDEWSEDIDETEQELLSQSDKNHMKALQSYKKELFLIVRSISPIRDVLTRIVHQEIDFMSPVIAVYHRDVLDHLIQVLDEIDLYRETVNTMVEVYLSSLSNRTNDIMKVLTVISTVFIPLTFITSLYGMNFRYMPELAQPLAYPLVWLVMLIIAASLLIYFKKKKWF